MKLKPIQAAPVLLLIGIFIFSACQVIKAAPLVDRAAYEIWRDSSGAEGRGE